MNSIIFKIIIVLLYIVNKSQLSSRTKRKERKKDKRKIQASDLEEATNCETAKRYTRIYLS